MKIDVLRPPPDDIFKDRRRYAFFFIVFLSLAGCGLLVGAYAIISSTKQYARLETTALALFAGSALFLTYFGEKLQAYKKLTPPQRKELGDLSQKHPEIQTYCDRVARANRQPIRAEYEACLEWAEDADSREEKD